MQSLGSLLLLLASAGLTMAQENGQPPNVIIPKPNTPECAQAQVLAQGIAANIADQQAELATANELGSLLSQQPVNQEQYQAARTTLLKLVNNGAMIRQTNQLIAPAGSSAAEGLGIVAGAQAEELDLVTKLSGEPDKDKPIVAELQRDFSGGIQQNMRNLAAAIEGCQVQAPQPIPVTGFKFAAPGGEQQQQSSPVTGQPMQQPTAKKQQRSAQRLRRDTSRA